MPDKKTREAVARDKRQGKSASTQAGEYVREEIEHIREGKHGARSTEQAIAIGLSKARRDGIKIPSKAVAKKRASSGAASSRRAAKKTAKRSTAKRADASLRALRKEPSTSVSRKSLSAHAKRAASKRSAASRSATAKKAARTKGAKGRSAAAKKAARTRAKSQH
jgi:hypothetical protein